MIPRRRALGLRRLCRAATGGWRPKGLGGATVLVVLLAPASAWATFSGRNGVLLLTGASRVHLAKEPAARPADCNGKPELWTVRPDGSHFVRLGFGADGLFSPSGRQVAINYPGDSCYYYTQNGGNGPDPSAGLFLSGADGKKRHRIRGSSIIGWLPNGRLIVVDPNDASRLVDALTGRRFMTAPGLSAGDAYNPDESNFAISCSGRVAVANGDELDIFTRHVVRVYGGSAVRTVKRTIATSPNGLDGTRPAWSPDGRSLLFAEPSGGGFLATLDLWSVGVSGHPLLHLTQSASDTRPTWAPDGRRILFQRTLSLANSPVDSAMVVNADGTGQHALSHGSALGPWSPDAHSLALSDAAPVRTYNATTGRTRTIHTQATWWIGRHCPVGIMFAAPIMAQHRLAPNERPAPSATVAVVARRPPGNHIVEVLMSSVGRSAFIGLLTGAATLMAAAGVASAGPPSNHALSIATAAAAAPQGQLSGVSCLRARGCMAVGAVPGGFVPDGGVVEHWNGLSWSIQSLPGSPSALSLGAVSCVSGSCVVVGSLTTSGGRRALAERWNGSSWKAQAPPTPAGHPRHLAGRSVLRLPKVVHRGRVVYDQSPHLQGVAAGRALERCGMVDPARRECGPRQLAKRGLVRSRECVHGCRRRTGRALEREAVVDAKESAASQRLPQRSRLPNDRLVHRRWIRQPSAARGRGLERLALVDSAHTDPIIPGELFDSQLYPVHRQSERCFLHVYLGLHRDRVREHRRGRQRLQDHAGGALEREGMVAPTYAAPAWVPMPIERAAVRSRTGRRVVHVHERVHRRGVLHPKLRTLRQPRSRLDAG